MALALLRDPARPAASRTGGINFDAKIRRQSIDPDDLLHAHVGSMDACARALLAAAEMIEDGALTAPLAERYAGWAGAEGKAILAGKRSLADLADRALRRGSIRSRARDGRNIWNLWSTATSEEGR